jgi:transposase
LSVAKGYRRVDRGQAFLLPVSMMDWLPEDHRVWFLIEAVNRLDTAAFHTRARLGGVGRRGYDPDMLLTLLVYAMACGVRSSRQIERLCHTDVAYRIVCAQDVPDHTVLAEFRRVHQQALADLFTQVLLLCAELGMVRLGVVAFDGVKIAANASREANRSEAGLRRLAEEHLAAVAATDAAEDALFGPDARGDELPEKVRDRTHRGQRIAQALTQVAQRRAAQAEQVAAAAAAGQAYQQQVATGRTRRGRPPKTADAQVVATARGQAAHAAAQQRWQRRRDRAKARWQAERDRAKARLDAWQARADTAAAQARKPPGSRPAPVDQQLPVRRTFDAYQQTLTEPPPEPPAPAPPAHTAGSHDNTHHADPASTGTGTGRAHQPRANLTDPDSRLMTTRNGWIQGYNCQTATSEDQFIIHAEPTQDPNDLRQFQPTADAVRTLANQLATHTGRTDLHVGTMIGDAGYDSDHNLTTPGPDRLIANAKHHTLATRTTTNPTTGDPPHDATPRQAMDHRLRTPDGHALYTRRSPIAETPHAWLKDRRGLRQFLGHGLPAARSELRFAAAVTNLLHLHHFDITTSHLHQPHPTDITPAQGPT